MARKTGVTEAGFWKRQKIDRGGGSSKVPAEGVGGVQMGVAVTEQRDEDQEGRGRGMGGGRTSEDLRQPNSVTTLR